MADDFGPRRAAWLTGELYRQPERLQPQCQHRGLSRLAGALTALEGDELASHPTHSIKGLGIILYNEL